MDFLAEVDSGVTLDAQCSVTKAFNWRMITVQDRAQLIQV